MKLTKLSLVPLAVLALGACDSRDDAEVNPADAIIAADAARGGNDVEARVGALGMTEAQLLASDLVSSDGTDLGDVESVQRGADGAVEKLVVEIDGSTPERIVLLPLDGLTTRKGEDGEGPDIVAPISAEELAALPEAPAALSAAAPEANL